MQVAQHQETKKIEERNYQKAATIPEKIKKQVDSVQYALRNLQAQDERVRSKLTDTEKYLANINLTAKGLLDDHAKTAATLERVRMERCSVTQGHILRSLRQYVRHV